MVHTVLAATSWDEHSDLVFDVHEDTFGRSDHVTFRGWVRKQFSTLVRTTKITPHTIHQPTSDNMIEEVGGQEELEKSMEFVMWAAMLEFIIADQTPEIRNMNEL